VARTDGFHFHDRKESAFSLVFNATAPMGTLSTSWAPTDIIVGEARDIYVDDGTGDFFMARFQAAVSSSPC
jgi:hypothetical protein